MTIAFCTIMRYSEPFKEHGSRIDLETIISEFGKLGSKDAQAQWAVPVKGPASFLIISRPTQPYFHDGISVRVESDPEQVSDPPLESMILTQDEVPEYQGTVPYNEEMVGRTVDHFRRSPLQLTSISDDVLNAKIRGVEDSELRIDLSRREVLMKTSMPGVVAPYLEVVGFSYDSSRPVIEEKPGTAQKIWKPLSQAFASDISFSEMPEDHVVRYLHEHLMPGEDYSIRIKRSVYKKEPEIRYIESFGRELFRRLRSELRLKDLRHDINRNHVTTETLKKKTLAGDSYEYKLRFSERGDSDAEYVVTIRPNHGSFYAVGGLENAIKELRDQGGKAKIDRIRFMDADGKMYDLEAELKVDGLQGSLTIRDKEGVIAITKSDIDRAAYQGGAFDGQNSFSLDEGPVYKGMNMSADFLKRGTAIKLGDDSPAHMTYVAKLSGDPRNYSDGTIDMRKGIRIDFNFHDASMIESQLRCFGFQIPQSADIVLPR